MSDPEIVVRGRSDLSGVTRGLSSVDDGLSRSSRAWDKFAHASKVAAGVAIAGAAAAGAAAFKLTQGAAEDAQGQALLATAYRNNADAKAKDIAASERWITAQGRTLGVADDELRPALTLLVGATHNVKKAQDDVSLALDVAAGRKVKLATVTKALERAENGNVSGLARLGVKTKDAAGETLSLDNITKQLAKTYGGQAAKAADTVQGKTDRVKLAFSEAGETIGAKFLPLMEKAADFALDQGVPAFEGLWRAAEKNGIDGVVAKLERLTGTQGKLTPILEAAKDVAADLGKIFNDAVVPAFRDAAGVLPSFLTPLGLARDALGFMADNTDVTKFALEGLITYLTIAKARMVLLNFATKDGATKMQRFGILAKQAAGAAGMAAFAKGAETSDRKAGFLLQTLGGAATGFALGGPWGALIGGTAGAAMSLFADGTDEAKDAMEKAAPKAADYASSLDQVSGAATRATGAQILMAAQDAGVLGISKQLGISTRDLTNATLGRQGALQRVNAALKEGKERTLEFADADGNLIQYTTYGNKDMQVKIQRFADMGLAYQGLAAEQEDLTGGLKDFIGVQRAGIREQGRFQRETNKTAQDFTKLRGKIPPKLLTRLNIEGVTPTLRGIAKVVNENKSLQSKKATRLLIEAVGADKTVAQVRKMQDHIKAVAREKIDFSNYTRSYSRGLQDADGLVQRALPAISRKLTDGTKNAKPDLTNYRSTLTSVIGLAKADAISGSQGIGASLKSGLPSGFAGADALWSSSVRNAVAAAIRAGRQEADAHSPSRKTMKLGSEMGDGLVIGLRARTRAAAKAGRDLLSAALTGVTGGSSGVSSSLDKLTAQIDKTFAGRLRDLEKHLRDSLKGKALDRAIREAEKASEKAHRSTIKALRDEYAQLAANGRAQDKITKQLDAAVSRYKQLVQASKQYAAGIKDAFIAYGSVVGLGANEDGSVSLANLLEQLKDRELRAERYAELIKQLTKDHLNATTLQQLIDAGVDGGLATAEAIAAGGSAAITQINALTTQIAKDGGTFGAAMAKQFKAAGIKAAASVVKGLEDRQAQLDRIADRMAQQLVNAVKRELGIGGGGGGGGNKSAARSVAARPVLTVAARGSEVVEIRLTAEQASAVTQGREIRAKTTSYASLGARTLAVG